MHSAGTIWHRREVIRYGEEEKGEEEGQEESSEEEGQEKSSEEEDQEKSYEEKSQEESSEEEDQEKSYEEESQEKKEEIGRRKRYGGFVGSKRREVNQRCCRGTLLSLWFSKSRDGIQQATLACVNGRSSRHGGIFHFFYAYR